MLNHYLSNMGKNKKLRLLITAECPNKCPLCCNNRFDLEKIPVVDSFDGYEEIMITGGEPLLFPKEVGFLAMYIKLRTKAKVYIYTANFNIKTFSLLSLVVDGFVYTPHSQKDVDDFIRLNDFVLSTPVSEHRSLRLNIFPEVEKFFHDVDLHCWKVKKMEWIKDCPVPEGEDFRRLMQLLIT